MASSYDAISDDANSAEYDMNNFTAIETIDLRNARTRNVTKDTFVQLDWKVTR